ncbi:Uncharacterized protein APZ42_013689 [Daphnia magna]|uniref:Uncharacterized protein n=1 Tax=Daphnia magna TaxID=35525 RepID=A0A162QQ92_9CRUS|nr:Uncharacterized protein APZ42_013689 [Daphnia magna]
MKIKRFLQESKGLGFLSFLGCLRIVFLYFNLKYLKDHYPYSWKENTEKATLMANAKNTPNGFALGVICQVNEP